MRPHNLIPPVMSVSDQPDSGGSPAGPGRFGVCLGPMGGDAFAALFPDFAIDCCRSNAGTEGLSGIVAWAGSRRGNWARRRAAALGVPFLLLGEGLLRTPPGWGRLAPVLSATGQLVIGPNSAADFLAPTRVLATRGWETPPLLARAAKARCDIVTQRLGGPWWRSGADRELSRTENVALIVAGEGGGGRIEAASSLLDVILASALAQNEAGKIVLLAPGQHRPHRFLRDAAARGCTVLTQPVDLWEAIARADCVYAAGGEAGFLALLAGRKVCCFADSFYSGWGITTDGPGVPQKPFGRSLDEIVAGACLVASRYLDPHRKKAASLEDTLQILREWRKIEAANRRIAVCLGMSFWKRRQVADFLRSGGTAPVFRRRSGAALALARGRTGDAIAVWASRAAPGLAQEAELHGIPLIRVEDGFVRSVGLGSDFMPAASLVLDGSGMHFDPSVRSDLERLLFETDFDAALIERARALTAQLIARGVTKYNLGSRQLSIGWPPAGRPRILVPGQVEDDLSVRLGGEGIRGNLELLERVRAANPKAFIAYKPHPDVEAGHRKGRISDEAAGKFADLVIRDTSTATLLTEIDELHTLTSLAGFEALLRRRRVVVYGRPFYAGWGLTTDLARVDRGRRLVLEELVAGALILYPRYLDPVTRLPCGPEIVIERLDDPELWRPGPLVVARRLQGLLARRWSEFAPRAATKLPARRFPSRGGDDFSTPQP